MTDTEILDYIEKHLRSLKMPQDVHIGTMFIGTFGQRAKQKESLRALLIARIKVWITTEIERKILS